MPAAQAFAIDCPIGQSPSFDGTRCETPGGTTQTSTPAPAPQKLTCPYGTAPSFDGTKCEAPPNKSAVDAPPGKTGGGNTVKTSGSGSGSVTQTPRGVDFTYVGGYFDDISYVINDLLVPLLMAFAFIFFLYGIYKYFILGADNDTELETGRKFALWGIIGFVLIVSVWGIVWIVLQTFSLPPGGIAPPTPTL